MPKTDNSFATYTSMMRVTKNGRPFAKDLYDMFAAVLLQINLKDHRVMFRTYPYTFTTDEAAKVMESLVFIHVHRNPDPANPSRQIATRTTTTFSMDFSTAKHMLQQFLSARLIVSATDPTNWNIRDKGLWCPTLKGKYVMEEFTDSTQVEMTDTLIAALNAPYMSPGASGSTGSRIITLDRMVDNDDQITFSRPNMTAAFKAMMSSIPRDALLIDDVGGVEKKSFGIFQYSFVGSHCVEWLCNRLTVTSVEEAESVAAEFLLFGWIAQILDKADKTYGTKEDEITFRTARNAIYYVTERGCVVTGWKPPVAEEPMQGGNQSNSSGLSLDSDASSTKKTIHRGASKTPLVPPPPSIMPKYNYYDSTENESGKIQTTLGPTDMARHDSATAMIEQALSQSSISQDNSSLEGGTANQGHPTTQRPTSMSITDSAISHNNAVSNAAAANVNKENSQWTRLTQILETPLMRLYFREFLRSNYSEENINFWVSHNRLLKNLKQNNKTVLEQLAECYAIYETYLGQDATADVNIDHVLHQEITKYVTTVFVIVNSPAAIGTTTTTTNAAPGTNGPLPLKNPYFVVAPTNHPTLTTNQPVKSTKASNRLLLMPPSVANGSKQRIVTIRGISPERCLIKLLKLFGKVNDHVCRMMAEDSVPKFIKTERYRKLIAKQQNDALATETDDEDDSDELSYEDSSDEDEDRRNILHLTTALSAQRSSMDHQRHETNINATPSIATSAI
ncbi:regulator of G protein signaling domain-containing protein [Mucor lusitanicus]|uniref:RGS domain-containing protein n=2 Tax=Mucor circinelloides f. lusitanicus TaxID=29924 RepID=A0A168MTZ7_MUCCL|nr:regulator of G protein signaling domain-containing protein [Mucor lusitanicus]OAD05364.1 hypothetical protein MUCCIDRAFT_109227 [Mucor lusitanicus CBS 277.49]